MGKHWLGLAVFGVLGAVGACGGTAATGGGGGGDGGAVCKPSSLVANVDLTHLPFGNSKILRLDQGQSTPAVGSLWLCGVPAEGRGNEDASAWTNADGTWDFTRKPTVDGTLTLESKFEAKLDGQGNRIVTGNALPRTPVGVFPIAQGSVAYQYDRNPSHIEAHDVNLTLPANPTVLATPRCVPYGATGILLTGNAFYHGSSTAASDAAAYEALDSCGGQSDGSFTYHTHFVTPCLTDALDNCAPGHSSLWGYAMDGFGIYGPRGEDGKVLASKDLDECHGHTHTVDWDGKSTSMYHYHWTYDFPYNVSCFRGVPVKAWNSSKQ